MNNIHVLGVGDIGASKTSGELIRTFALGSCVAVIFIHPRTPGVGMAHIALPTSSIDPKKAIHHKPGHFADQAIPALLFQLRSLGLKLSGKDKYNVKLAGGANIMNTNDTFKIGERNVKAIKKILLSYGMTPIAENIGGTFSRTVTVCVDTGAVIISSPARGEWQL